MKLVQLTCCLAFVVSLAPPLYADTYSWIDENGTYNFTEEYSSVPKKFRKKVKRREDIPQEVKQTAAPSSEHVVKAEDKKGEAGAATSGSEKELYGGKTRAAWRNELDTMESELRALEIKIEQARLQINEPKGINDTQFEVLRNEYNANRLLYDSKYKSYKELVDTIRKTGLAVDIKK
jgi:hypothetical protein